MAEAGSKGKSSLRLIAVIIVALILIGVLYQFVYLPSQVRRPIKEFQIDVRTFEAGSFSAKTITVDRGDVVVLHVKAVDVPHGFKIDELNVDTGIIAPGETKTVRFVADKSGTFTFYCTIVCSPKHLDQKGMLTIR